MSELGFLPDGGQRHERACLQRIAELRQRLAACAPTERAQIERDIEQVERERQAVKDPTILW